jgi:1-aminocyclopropane-1-carboxylate deaminase/D-cysteine desulfhydrase-like pyridoxal-dependent ACC family enzyme
MIGKAMPTSEGVRRRLAGLATLGLIQAPTAVQELTCLRELLGKGPRLLLKRDDLLGFGFGGNKVRKLELVAARARAEGCDTLVTTGSIQSNHARVTAAVAARLGMRCVLVLNGMPPEHPVGNARLVEWLGAEIHYVASRADRSPAMGAAVERLTDHGHHPFMVPLGASTPLGALGYARAITELLTQVPAPDVIIHSTSSGGTQAGLLAGCALHGLRTHVIGISADDPADVIGAHIRGLLDGMTGLISLGSTPLAADRDIDIDDRFTGGGYGIPSPESDHALRLVARHEGVFLDPTYTAKAMAALIAYLREGRFHDGQTVLFWHTGGLPGLFA